MSPFWFLWKSNTSSASARGVYNLANYTAVYEETKHSFVNALFPGKVFIVEGKYMTKCKE